MASCKLLNSNYLIPSIFDFVFKRFQSKIYFYQFRLRKQLIHCVLASTTQEQTKAGFQWKRFLQKALVPRVSSLGSHGRRGEAPPDDAEPLRRSIRGRGRARHRFRARIQPPTQLPLRTCPISCFVFHCTAFGSLP